MANKYRQMLMFSNDHHEFYAAHPFGLIDAGARCDIPEPWNFLPSEHLRTVGFEPDSREAARLQSAAPAGRTYVDKALWSERASVDVHLAVVPATSSVHPPNFDVLKNFQEENWRPRQTDRVVSVQAETIDGCLAEMKDSFDFLKVDVHGAEFEILVGSQRALQCDLTGVVVESWNVEAHCGQKQTGDIMNELAKHDFTVFEVFPTVAWRRREWAELRVPSKRQLAGQSTLFFKEPARWDEEQMRVDKIVRSAAIAEVYGYPDFALHILDVGLQRVTTGDLDALRSARQQIVNHWTGLSLISRLRYRVGRALQARIRRLFNLDNEFARLS